MSKKRCPKCQAEMVLRTALKGKNAGGQFWGCSKFPECKGTLPSDDDKLQDSSSDAGLTSGNSDELAKVPVHWRDALPRRGYYSEYISLGAVPGFLVSQPALQSTSVRRISSQALLLSRRCPPIMMSDDLKTVSSVIQKILTRGTLPLCTLGVEAVLAYNAGIEGNVQKLDDRNIEIGWKWVTKRPIGLAREIILAAGYRTPISDSDLRQLVDQELQDVLDGEKECYFFEKWCVQTLGARSLHWLMPQAELDLILASAGHEQSGQRKIDFLFFHPSGVPIAIELDGQDHSEKVKSDAVRNTQLSQIGIATYRIPNQELELGDGENLRNLEQALKSSLLSSVETFSGGTIPYTVTAASMAARFQFVLARALGSAQLKIDADQWVIEVRSDYIELEILQAAADDFSKMLGALGALYLRSNRAPKIRCISDGNKQLSVDLTIAMFTAESPLSLSLRIDDEDYVVCPAVVPADLATNAQKILHRQKPATDGGIGFTQSLLFFLQNLFRKRQFREFQPEGIRNTLAGKDTVILLPTGAGKSIIYQLAGLLQPGITIVVDPIVALIEDQIVGLARVGIDKAGAAPPSGIGDPHKLNKWLRSVERSDYQFILISPERLQMGNFREALRSLAQGSFVNIAVIDEAHCVSEWGHDFRFAYLNLADNLRNYCSSAEGASPTLLALTGTASRSVLRELLTELKIGRDDSDALIRPLSFNRRELKFHRTKVNTGGDSAPELRGILNGLPGKFNIPPGEFFKPAGTETNSGIIFTPFVNHWTHGLIPVKSKVSDAVNTPVTIYSGTAPKGISNKNWETEKRRNAQSFKDNESPILVATKAFGMGIDKPNIRWIVHMGVPSSMEALYQEAGRAGRDKNLAICTLIFSEENPDATDWALSAQRSLEELRVAAAKFKKYNDDVSRLLFFHLDAYSGVEDELAEIANILNQIGDINDRRSVEVTFKKSTRAEIERSILRLIKTGIVDDMEVNYGSGFFTLKLTAFDFERSRMKIEQYIRDSQRARLKTIEQRLDGIAALELSSQPFELCKLMVNFSYDVIERSRRRMLYEAILLGRNYGSNHEIKQHLLDYLQEGLGAERIAELAEQQEIDFYDWLGLFDRVSTQLEAGQLRGIIIRLLETFPDHPGMLAARGIAEALVTNPDQNLIRDSMLSCLEYAYGRYSCSQEQTHAFIEQVITLANDRASQLRLPIVSTLQQSSTIDEHFRGLLWERLNSMASTWDYQSKLCVATISIKSHLDAVIAEASMAVRHHLDIHRELT